MWTVVIAVVGLLTAICTGVAGILATATVSARPAVFLGAGVAVFLLADLALTALRPPAAPAAASALPGESVTRVSTGSRLAVVHLAATGPVHRTPIVVVHGGPGVPDLEANARAFAPLAAHGSDVYLYAELGAGRSARLTDPRGYGRTRDVADLEALRRRLGLDRMALVGHPYGGALAAAYLAAHPRRVDGLVLLSPGAPTRTTRAPTTCSAGCRQGNDCTRMPRCSRRGPCSAGPCCR